MIGNNSLILNKATMCEIVQQWVDNYTRFHVEVDSIVVRNKDIGEVFEVMLVPKIEEKPHV